MARRVAVLISGSGSNLQALIDAQGTSSYEIVHVLANMPDAFGLRRAERAGIASSVIDHRHCSTRTAFDAAIAQVLADAGAELVCLAGFMRILGPDLVDAWRDRILNIHPALLPSFRGLDTHQRALAAGVRVHGCTVHVVRPALDDGPIVAQGIVPVLADDDAMALAQRVLAMEHRVYPLALDLLASGRARVVDDRVELPAGSSAVLVHRDLAAHPSASHSSIK